MKLTIRITMDNAAFGEDDCARCVEVGRILRELAHSLEAAPLERGHWRNLRDVNGNTVGEAKVTA